MDFQNSIDAGKADILTKKRSEAQNKQNSADAGSELQETSKTRGDDFNYLTDLQQICVQKRTDFESRQNLRSEEVQALEKALELLSSDAVAGAAQRHLPASSLLSRRRTGTAVLAQMRGSADAPPPQLRVAAFLAGVSKRIGSNLLSTVAYRARDDPFEKVKQLIQELIDRLESEAGEEATHKNWCDSELSANGHTRTTKSAEIETLTGRVESMQAGIAMLKRDIAEISTTLAELAANIAKQTELRSREKKQNEQTIQEATDAQTALSEVLNVLQDFYGKASEATSLAQTGAVDVHQQQPAPPPIFNSPFKGQQLKSNNVVAMLEVLQSDFARLEGETADAENAASNEYDTFMTESQIDKESKAGEMSMKKTTLKSEEGVLLTVQDDLNNAHAALEAAQKYFDELKPSCLNEGSTFQERNQRRDEEIESLKEALRILNGADVAVVQGVLVKDQGAAGQSTLRSATTGLDYKQ
jgi:hypothetical protein